MAQVATLLAVIASMYAVYHGPNGLRSIAERIHTITGALVSGFRNMGMSIVNDRSELLNAIARSRAEAEASRQEAESIRQAAEAARQQAIAEQLGGILGDEGVDAFNENGVSEGDLVFVSGHPGSTSRLETTAMPKVPSIVFRAVATVSSSLPVHDSSSRCARPPWRRTRTTSSAPCPRTTTP